MKQYSETLREAVFETATLGVRHLHSAKELEKKGLTRGAIYALAGPAARASLYLEELQQSQFDPTSKVNFDWCAICSMKSRSSINSFGCWSDLSLFSILGYLCYLGLLG